MHSRRRFFATCTAGAALFWERSVNAAPKTKFTVTTHTFKRVGQLDIKADIHRPDTDAACPIVVWIHGGALINGHRAGINGRVRDRMLDHGYAIVSIDYRLAPETKLPDIIRDVEDAFVWIRKQAPAVAKLDSTKLAVMGGSAGGYLTLTSGFRAIPRPDVLVSFWGYGDLVGDWYSKPSPHPRHHRAKLSREDAYRQVAGPPVSDSRLRQGNGGSFYQYCRQHGIWPQEVSTWDPHSEADKFSPFMPVKNVTPSYPPTLMIHGTKDTDVPYEQSVIMAEQFKQHGVEHQLVAILDGEHGLGGGDPQVISAAYEKAFAFVDRHML